jgi:hypothetical protein
LQENLADHLIILGQCDPAFHHAFFDSLIDILENPSEMQIFTLPFQGGQVSLP